MGEAYDMLFRLQLLSPGRIELKEEVAFEFSHTLAFIFSVIIFLGCALRTSALARRTEFIRLKTEVKRRKGGKSAMLAEKSDE